MSVGYYGDYLPGSVVHTEFSTVTSSGAPAALLSPSVTVSRDGADVTPSGGVTITASAGGVTGYNTLAINTSADSTTFAAGHDYAVRLAGSSNVGGTSVAGIVVASFSLAHRSVAVDASGGVNTTKINGAAIAGGIPANVTEVNGQAVSPLTGAVPANVTEVNGTTFTGAFVPANLNLAQAVPATNTAQTVGDALNAARAQGFGKWAMNAATTPPTLTLYAADGVTIVRSFQLDSATAPTQRT